MSLSSGNIRDDLSFHQCEADTIMLSVYAILRSSGHSNPVVVDAEDTDVYIQAAAISDNIPGIICMKEFFFCRAMCSDEDIAKCLIPFHVMTGCDANSCFYGHGKKVLFERMAKARNLLSRCGDQLRDDASDDLEAYIFRYVYGDLQSSSLDLACAAKWKKLKKKSLMRLPHSVTSVPTSWHTFSITLSLRDIPLLLDMAGNLSMATANQFTIHNQPFLFHFQPPHIKIWMILTLIQTRARARARARFRLRLRH